MVSLLFESLERCWLSISIAKPSVIRLMRNNILFFYGLSKYLALMTQIVQTQTQEKRVDKISHFNLITFSIYDADNCGF